MFADFFLIHADVIRNAAVLLIWVLSGSLLTVLITRWFYRKKAYREANAYIIQENVELRVALKELRSIQKDHLSTIERLTIVQNGAISAARSVQDLVNEAKRE